MSTISVTTITGFIHFLGETDRCCAAPNWRHSVLAGKGTQVLTEFRSHLKLRTRHQKPDIKQIPYCGPSSIWRHRTKFSQLDPLTPWTCVPQLTTVSLCLCFEITEQVPDWLRAGQPGIDFWQGLGISTVVLRPVLIPNQCPIQCVFSLGYNGRSVYPTFHL